MYPPRASYWQHATVYSTYTSLVLNTVGGSGMSQGGVRTRQARDWDSLARTDTHLYKGGVFVPALPVQPALREHGHSLKQNNTSPVTCHTGKSYAFLVESVLNTQENLIF